MSRTPIHAGEILSDELEALELSAAGLARILDVPPNRLTQIMSGKRKVTADTALRLAKFFGTSADFWINLQKMFELDTARAEIGSVLDHIPHRKNTGHQSHP